MKRGILLLSLLIIASSINLVSAQTPCNLNAELVNQDPYPAIPGDYVKLVFQLEGIANPSCGKVDFEVLQEFPFSLDPNVSAKTTIQAGTYTRNYQSYAILPYKIRVGDEALDGENKLEVLYSNDANSAQLKQFSIEVDDVRADFEVSIKDYNKETNKVTFEILNIAKNDIEALTIEAPKQESFSVKGSNREVIGSLDANEATTFSFEGTPSDGQINLKIVYTDAANIRRELNKSVYYDSEYFTGRVSDQTKTSPWTYIISILIIVLVVWKIRSSIKKKKHEKMRKMEALARQKSGR